ncbi:unnamed protein product [Spodoptera exigua]|nr:unnamed protein product [Spodoptera exigua]
MRSKKCHELDSQKCVSRAVPHKADEGDALTWECVRASVTRVRWNEVQHRRRDPTYKVVVLNEYILQAATFTMAYNETNTRWINTASAGVAPAISSSENIIVVASECRESRASLHGTAPILAQTASTFHSVHCPFGVNNEKHKESNSICVVSWEPSANYEAATFLLHYAHPVGRPAKLYPLCVVPATISQMQITST